MAITDERREELIDWLRKAEHPSPADAIWLEPDSARDILAMLREAAPSKAAPTITFRPYEPPKPETLADVPDWCVVEGQDGRLYFRRGVDVWLLGEENPFDIKVLADEPHEITVTRVLGYPVLGGGE